MRKKQKKKLRIYYRGITDHFCPFCGGMGDIFVESNVCGGYRSHGFCLEDIAEWQDKTKIFVNVLAPNQKPEDCFNMNVYKIESVIDKIRNK